LVVIQPPPQKKAHPWVRTRHLSHKIIKIRQGVGPGRSCERKKYNQDRTIIKSQKCNNSHIWGIAPSKDIAMKFGKRVDVFEVVTWAKFDL